MDLLVFTVNADRFGIPASDIEQVVRAVAVTALPGAPAVVEGIVDVRGSIVPVLDLRLRFGLPAQALRLSDLLIIASSGPRRVAIRCDEGADLRQIDPASLQRSGEPLTSSRYVAGLATLPDGVVVIHDLDSFLSEAESESLTKALAALKAERAA